VAEPYRLEAAWERCPADDAAEALADLAEQLPAFFAGANLVAARRAQLRFYAEHRLIELEVNRGAGSEIAYVLHGEGATRWLNGSSEPIHDTNEDEALELAERDVL